jgi:hypothetical protein
MKESLFIATVVTFSIVALSIALNSCGALPQQVTIVKDGRECTAELGPDGKPTNIKCDLGDGGL